MGDASDRLMKLRPVTFRYTQEPAGPLQYGLVAEEVAQVYPELVAYGDDRKPLSVAYNLLPAMCSTRCRSGSERISEKTKRIVVLQEQLVTQQGQINALQKEAARIDTLAARLSALEEQARTDRAERLAAATH
jgi:CMP-2-keto-3-deoxyoctulosonic acid synthetase